MKNPVDAFVTIIPCPDTPYVFVVKPLNKGDLLLLVERFSYSILTRVIGGDAESLVVKVDEGNWSFARKWIELIVRNMHVVTDCDGPVIKHL